MDETETAENLVHELGRRQADALRALRFSGGSANGGEIRDIAGIPNGSSTHHFRGLAEQDLIAHHGWEHVGQGGKEKVWELTARGKTVAEELSDGEPTIDEIEGVIESVDEHGDQLAGLADRGEERDKSIEELRREVADLKARYSEVKGALDKVLAYIEEERDEEEEGF